MLERLSKNTHICYLDGYSGFSQIHVRKQDEEKTTFTCPYGTYAYRCMPFGLCYALIRPKRIYNFWCSMLVFYPMPYVFHMFSFVFWMFSQTNLLTRCLVPVFVFCCFCISEKFLKKYSQKGLKIYGDLFLLGRPQEPKGHPEGSHRGTK